MAKKIFVGRRREAVRYWNIMFQMGEQIILSQAASYGPLNLDELRMQLKLHPLADVLVEPVSSAV